MDYTAYQPEDFAADSFFRQWVRHPDAASDAYWHDFLATYPGKQDAVTKAIALVNGLSAAASALTPPANPAEQRAVWQAIEARLANESNPPKPSTSVRSPFVGRTYGSGWRWLAAASVVLGLVWWQYMGNDSWSSGPSAQHAEQPAAPVLVERTNTTDKPLLVLLPDGSSLLLKKASTVRFASRFTDSARVVNLTGEAFFEVVKDPAHPFLVCTDRFITKVLGTSFMVRAYAADQDAVVTVRSGRVAVFASADQEQRQQRNSPLLHGTVLTKNQQMVLTRHHTGTPDRLPHKLQQLSPASTHQLFAFIPDRFVFSDAPVSEVFAQLEKMYGIHIRYDQETLGTCRLTADLTDEPLAQKMLIICKSIEASYAINGTQLTLTGPGCHPVSTP